VACASAAVVSRCGPSRTAHSWLNRVSLPALIPDEPGTHQQGGRTVCAHFGRACDGEQETAGARRGLTPAATRRRYIRLQTSRSGLTLEAVSEHGIPVSESPSRRMPRPPLVHPGRLSRRAAPAHSNRECTEAWAMRVPGGSKRAPVVRAEVELVVPQHATGLRACRRGRQGRASEKKGAAQRSWGIRRDCGSTRTAAA